MSNVICDWLDLTYSPDDWPELSLTNALNSAGCFVVGQSLDDAPYRVDWGCSSHGRLVITRNTRHARISFSGGFLGFLRDGGCFDPLLSVLSESPYRVTRIDCALDFPIPAGPVITALWGKYPERCALTRKAIGTTVILETVDGQATGTFYVGGNRSKGASAKVYDKQRQMQSVFGSEVGPMIRYEVTARAMQFATLRDAYDPSPLFWSLAAPSLLELPPDVEPWQAADPDDTGWLPMPKKEFCAYTVLVNRLENSPDFAALESLADQLGPEGRRMLFRLLEKRLLVRDDRSGQLSAPG